MKIRDGELRFVEEKDRFGRSKWRVELSLNTDTTKLLKKGKATVSVKKVSYVDVEDEIKAD